MRSPLTRELRRLMSLALMVLGGVMLVRGIAYSVAQNLGWQGIVQAVAIGALIFGLGFARWRFWASVNAAERPGSED